LALFQRGGVGGEERKTDGEPRESNVVVDARGGNSHEAGGRRLAVLKLSPSSDWPCTRCSLVTVLLLENWRLSLSLSLSRLSPSSCIEGTGHPSERVAATLERGV